MQLFLVIGLLIYPSHSWVLEKSHKQVILGNTKNVSLECKYDNQDNGEQRIAEVTGLTIHKFHGNDQWETYAKIRDTYEIAVLGDGVGSGVSVKGHADRIQNSFLSMTWSTAFPNITGLYACEIYGFAEDDENVQVVTNPVSIIGAHLSLQNLLAMVLNFKGLTEKHLEQSAHMFGHLEQLVQTVKGQTENHHNQSTQMFDHIEQLVQKVDGDLDSFRNATQVRMQRFFSKEEVNAIIDSKIQKWHETAHWPGGQYALLKTENGCPNLDNNVWTGGYIKFPSESSGSRNLDSISKASHFAQPVLEKNGTQNFVYIRTCKHTTNTSGLAWPKGKYCLHRFGGYCPEQFYPVDLRLDAEDSYSSRVDYHNAPDASGQHIYFCCRNDGAATTPIYLPVETSFYLYRNMGTCQKVHNAKVTQEWLQIDTEDHSNEDSKSPSSSLDVTLNPANFSLCYYTKLH